MEDFNIGIDIGSMFVKLVFTDEKGEVKDQIYEPHKGNPIEKIKNIFSNGKYNINGSSKISVTGKNAELLLSQGNFIRIDETQAIIKAVKQKFPEVRNIMDIGGGSATLIRLNENGEFESLVANSLCAAGTGSFLDEQADRLQISYKDIAKFSFEGNPPNIATRCSVFAKSDLIHRQQEGYSKEAMWSGLCKSMTSTTLHTLLKGKPLEGLTVLVGGVAQNKEVFRWLKNIYRDNVKTYNEAHLVSAIGSSLMINGQKPVSIDWKKVKSNQVVESKFHKCSSDIEDDALMLRKSKYPSFEVEKSYKDNLDNEVRITFWPRNTVVKAYIGVDIGSTSTKAILIDKEGKVFCDIYRRTLGEPINAVKKLFTAIENINKDYQTELDVLGCGTTGSGRKMIGYIIGADVVKNEISTHVAGSVHIDDTIETIFEIGGQDSKYIKLKNGFIYDSNMNYVCAAGTGSFVEEQAKKLGIPLNEIGERVIGTTPPKTSDRCTVFMEQDVLKLVRQGYSEDECIAGVLQSIVKNYISKVVGSRTISKSKIFFHGATARNKGLVAAFEKILDTEIVVSPYCHVMGAFGIAQMVRMEMTKTNAKSRFFGLELSKREVRITTSVCEYCSNKCTISHAKVEGVDKTASWGYMCGRDPDETRLKVFEEYKPFKKRKTLLKTIGKSNDDCKTNFTIGMPMSLTTYTYLPFFRTLLSHLNFKFITTEQTNERIAEKGKEIVGADFCYPMKVAHGHFVELLNNEELDYIFLPTMISNRKSDKISGAMFCPWVQSYPGVVTSSSYFGKDISNRILKPIIDFRFKQERMVREIYDTLGKRFKLKKANVRKAVNEAISTQRQFENTCQEEGNKVLSELKNNNKKGIVVLGRPYNTLDDGITLNIPQKIAEYGITIIPIDFIPFKVEELDDDLFQMYWSYGQRILNAIKFIQKSDNLYGIYLTNFSCGPDSFILTQAEKYMGDKPFLTLELDEHGADAGYITRVEAFLDVIENHFEKPKTIKKSAVTFSQVDLKHRTIWVPPMHPITKRLFSAAFKGYGYKSEPLPQENTFSFEIGKAECRGSECLPTSLTIGTFLKTLQEINAKAEEHALFMPTAEGPCRFGQYATLHRDILDRKGYQNTMILSPSSQNAYFGLEEGVRYNLWVALLTADILFKIQCKYRPYEKVKGDVDELITNSTASIEHIMSMKKECKKDIEGVLANIVKNIQRMEFHREKKPLVGIVGEIYIRCNPYGNEFLIDNIEKYGGEAWLAPISEWLIYTAYVNRWLVRNAFWSLKDYVVTSLTKRFFDRGEKYWYKVVDDLLHDRHEPNIKDVIDAGKKYLPLNFEGEALLTIGRAIMFGKQNANMVVNCAPFGCMPGAISTSIFQKVQSEYRLPIANLFYDGNFEENSKLEIFLNNIKIGM